MLLKRLLQLNYKGHLGLHPLAFLDAETLDSSSTGRESELAFWLRNDPPLHSSAALAFWASGQQKKEMELGM